MEEDMDGDYSDDDANDILQLNNDIEQPDAIGQNFLDLMK